MSAVALSPSALDGLASEYYGSVLSGAAHEDHETTVIEFNGPDSDSNLAAMTKALDSYRRPA